MDKVIPPESWQLGYMEGKAEANASSLPLLEAQEKRIKELEADKRFLAKERDDVAFQVCELETELAEVKGE